MVNNAGLPANPIAPASRLWKAPLFGRDGGFNESGEAGQISAVSASLAVSLNHKTIFLLEQLRQTDLTETSGAQRSAELIATSERLKPS